MRTLKQQRLFLVKITDMAKLMQEIHYQRKYTVSVGAHIYFSGQVFLQRYIIKKLWRNSEKCNLFMYWLLWLLFLCCPPPWPSMCVRTYTHRYTQTHTHSSWLLVYELYLKEYGTGCKEASILNWGLG